MGKFAGEILLVGGNLKRSAFDLTNLFQGLKKFCIYWTSIKTKISMTCVYKEYEDKLLGYNMKIV